MKTMVKKYGICAVFAAVLSVTVALVTACPASAPETAGRLPAGMSTIRLNFSNEIARATILPDTATINDFAEFILTFTPVTGGSPITPITRTFTTRNDPVTLVTGTYSLVVVAYLTASTPASAAAVWSSTAPHINVATTPTLTITLTPYDPDDATVDGTFAWNITSTITGLTSITMTVTELDGTATAITNQNITGTLVNNIGVALPSNYYYVDFVVVAAGETRNFRHVLHIYQNMTSTFTYSFTDDHIGVESIQFTPNIEYTHPTDSPPTVTVAPVTSTNAVAGTGTAADPYILSLSDNTYPDDLTITVTNFATFTGDVEYFVNGTSLGTGASLVVPATAPFDTAGGPYQISVVGTDADGVPYSIEIFILVDEDL